MRKFLGKVIGDGRGAAPTRQGQSIMVSARGRNLEVYLIGHRNDLGQDSFRIDIARAGRLTSIGDITDKGDGEWVLNVYDLRGPGKVSAILKSPGVPVGGA